MDSALCLESTEDLVHTLKQLVWDRTNGGIRQIEVEIQDEKVILTGESDSFYYKQQATHAVMNDFDTTESFEFVNQIQVT